MLRRLAPYLLFGLYRLLYWTWRIEVRETPEVKELVRQKKPFIVAHWHGDELGVLHLLKRYSIATIISKSRDGDLMNKAVQLLGGQTTRGSSTRGGSEALRGILGLSKKGYRPCVAVDGPKGPIYQVKPGVMQISRLSGLPIFPISFHASRCYIFRKAWSQTRLPLPFSKLTIQWGEPVGPLQRHDQPKDGGLARELALKLDLAKKKSAMSL